VINTPQRCYVPYPPQFSAPVPIVVPPPPPPPLPAPRCYHTCAVCGRVRSKGFHRDNPIQPGKGLITSVCRRCRTWELDESPRKRFEEKGCVKVRVVKDIKSEKRGKSPKKWYRIVRRARSVSHEREHRPRASSRTRIIIRRRDGDDDGSPTRFEEIRHIIEESEDDDEDDEDEDEESEEEEEDIVYYYRKPEDHVRKPSKYWHKRPEKSSSHSPVRRRYITRQYFSPSPVRLNTKFQYSPERVTSTEIRYSRSRDRGSPTRRSSPDGSPRPRSILISRSRDHGRQSSLRGHKVSNKVPRVHFSDESSSCSSITVKPAKTKKRYKVVEDTRYTDIKEPVSSSMCCT
jgi:hypothetical protein